MLQARNVLRKLQASLVKLLVIIKILLQILWLFVKSLKCDLYSEKLKVCKIKIQTRKLSKSFYSSPHSSFSI